MTLAFEPVTAADLQLPTPQALSAIIPLVVVALMMWRRVLPRVAACITLAAGAALSTGPVGDVTQDALGWLTPSKIEAVVPGALALVLVVYWLIEVAPDAATLDKLRRPSGEYERERRYGRSRHGAGAGHNRYGATATGTRRLPEKVGAAGVGLVLPSVTATVPGAVGAVSMSVMNIAGGALAWTVAWLWGGA